MTTRLNRYILSNLSNIFLPIFFTLFLIASIVYLVKIAALTSVIQLDISELFYLYYLNSPYLLFYTLPVTFFISVVITISKLANEYELIIFTSLGVSPLKIMKLFIPISLLFSIVIFIMSFVLVPKFYYMEKIFINQKKKEAQFNITPSAYGQRFASWFIYVNKKLDNDYEDIILYKHEKHSDKFIVAKKANIFNEKASLSLELYDGSSSTIKDDLQYIEFQKMIINHTLKNLRKISSLTDIVYFWKDRNNSRTKSLLKNFFLSILPIVSLLFYIALGYYNPRYQNNHATIFSILTVILYVVLMQTFANSLNLYTMIIFPIIWIGLSILLYIIRVKKYY